VTGFELDGKRVLVTGASSGIGAALAEGFAARGAIVGICARRTDRLADVLTRLKAHQPECRSWTVDLADLDGIEAFARTVENDLGGVDVLVNNAGIPKRRRVTALTWDEVEAVNRINYLSPMRLTLALLPGIIERKGRIVTIASVAGRFGPPAEAAYAATKAAVTAWSESMRVDLTLADTGVGVHVVHPGVLDTELFQLPGNDPFPGGVEALPVESIVEPVVEQLRSGTFEIYVPEWFKDIAAGKFTDVDGFLEGTIAFAREMESNLSGGTA
jgi:NAD(P)-dependent dehydrogenase (short-subunit alcohol dehydrogenase family)